MARIRSVHPSLFTDEAWVSCSPLARILYIGLWTDADDQGLFEWKPLQIKMRLLPGDAGDVPAMLAELSECGLILAYEVEGKRFGAIASFRKFQRPQKPNAIHPMTESIALFVGLSPTDQVPVADHSDTAPVIAPQMEDGGEDVEDTTVTNVPVVTREPKPKASKRCPDDWTPSPADIATAADLGFSPGEIERELATIRDCTFGVARSDWSATFRNWFRREAKNRKPRNDHPSPDRKYDAKQSNYAASWTGADGADQVLASRRDF